jgi:hypothetical protein
MIFSDSCKKVRQLLGVTCYGFQAKDKQIHKIPERKNNGQFGFGLTG